MHVNAPLLSFFLQMFQIT